MSQEFREALGAIAAELLAEAHNTEWLGRQSITVLVAPSALHQLARRVDAIARALRTVGAATDDVGVGQEAVG